MFKGIKIKVAVTSMLLTAMLCSGMVSQAGIVSGFGEVSLPYSTGAYRKTTNDGCSDLTVGDVSIYDQILACTYSMELGGGYVQSNPWTTCYENDATYLGQYNNIERYVGQSIYLNVKQRSGVTETYAARLESWDYH